MEADILHNVQPLNKKLKLQCWYAVYTRPHHEKKVYEHIYQENIIAFLPMQTTIKQWSDRKKKVSEPLFSCYLFVNITAKDYYTVLNIPGVVRYITFEGKAVPIPEKQIQLIKNILEQDIETTEVLETIHTGNRVEIKTGPLTGMTGELIEYAGKKRVIIRIEEICKSILVNVPINLLRLAEQ
jgi:transcriptional antiterminator RfaH